jgi:hypothetical protein
MPSFDKLVKVERLLTTQVGDEALQEICTNLFGAAIKKEIARVLLEHHANADHLCPCSASPQK